MSGHNKWSKIKHKKAATDAKKSKEFSRLARLIAVESKQAGGDTSSPALKAAIDKARAANMPSDNIERAVAKGRTDTGAAMERVSYETYGPGGVALIIEGLTDNRNRTNSEIKHIVGKLGYALAQPGSASWAFEHVGAEWQPHTTVDLSQDDRDKLETLVDQLEEQEDVQAVFTNAA